MKTTIQSIVNKALKSRIDMFENPPERDLGLLQMFKPDGNPLCKEFKANQCAMCPLSGIPKEAGCIHHNTLMNAETASLDYMLERSSGNKAKMVSRFAARAEFLGHIYALVRHSGGNIKNLGSNNFEYFNGIDQRISNSQVAIYK